MNGCDVAKHALKSSQEVLGWYLQDLSDADLLVRPAPSANHIAWQLGHLIAAEHGMMKEQAIVGASWPELPAGFKDQHNKSKASSEVATGFGTKAQYLELFNSTRKATIAAVRALADADLDRPTVGTMAKNAPRLGDLLLLQANHTLMHAGQFTVVRRKLGKPIVF